MRHEDGRLQTPAGRSIYHQSWWPAGRPKAALLVAHGLAEHSGRYRHFARYFTERDYAVSALDYPGHGRSDGVRCHIARFSELTDSLGMLLDRTRAECAGVPLVLVGHSMGALVATRYLIDHQAAFAACVLSGAAVLPAAEISPAQRLLMRLMSSYLPRLRMLRIDGSQISRDPQVVDRYREDPLVFTGKVTARLAEQLSTTMKRIVDRLAAIELPMLILHGSRDGLTSPEGSRLLHERIGSSVSKLVIYEGLYHEVYNEPEKDTVMGDVADWLAQCLAIPADRR